ncbi:MAG: response regulator transcription factor [Rhodanobacteraceae bacterium]
MRPGLAKPGSRVATQALRNGDCTMYLSRRKTRVLSELFVTLGEPHGEAEIRRRVGRLVLDLLDADYYASYVWNRNVRAFTHRISLNMSDSNLATYEQYYQHHDPITPALQARREPTLVNQVMSQSELMKTEFFNDFLFRDGLYWGVNVYAWDGSDNIGDMRIWRSSHRGNFCTDALELLGLIRPAFVAALHRARSTRTAPSNALPAPGLQSAGIAKVHALTVRECQIARLAAAGYSDKVIANRLGIGFTTVRTHIEHIFRKLDVDSRVRLAGLLSAPTGTEAGSAGRIINSHY